MIALTSEAAACSIATFGAAAARVFFMCRRYSSLYRLDLIRSAPDLFMRNVPDVAGILPDRAIGGKPAHPRNVADRLGVPLGTVAPDRVDLALGVRVGIEIGRDHEPVGVVERVEQIAVTAWIVRRKHAR